MFTCGRRGQNSLSLTYFGKFDFYDLLAVKDNILVRDVIKNEYLLVVDMQDLFNMSYINCDAVQEFQQNAFNQVNVIFLTII